MMTVAGLFGTAPRANACLRRFPSAAFPFAAGSGDPWRSTRLLLIKVAPLPVLIPVVLLHLYLIKLARVCQILCMHPAQFVGNSEFVPLPRRFLAGLSASRGTTRRRGRRCRLFLHTVTYRKDAPGIRMKRKAGSGPGIPLHQFCRRGRGCCQIRRTLV